MATTFIRIKPALRLVKRESSSVEPRYATGVREAFTIRVRDEQEQLWKQTGYPSDASQRRKELQDSIAAMRQRDQQQPLFTRETTESAWEARGKS